MAVFFPILRVAAFALGMAAVAPSWSADPLSLEEALRIAVSRAPQLQAQQALSSAAREQAVAAGQLPDPVLKLGIDNLPVDGPDRGSLTRDFMTMRRIGVMQEIPRADKLRFRAEKFELEAGRIQAQRQQALAGVRQGSALAWLDRYYAQAQRALALQQLDETGLQVQAADVAFRTGRGSQADVFAARAAVISQQDRLSQIDRQSRSAGLMLARWVGSDVAGRPSAGPPDWQSTPLQDAVLSEYLAQHPDLRLVRAEIDAAQADARLAQANKQADISVEASYAQRGSAFSNMLSIGVSIPLQWDQKNRQDRELAAKLALVDEANARHEDVLRKTEAEVGSLRNEWQTGKDRLARFRDALIPAARQRTEAAQTAYRIGKSELAAALLARRDEIDVRMQALNLEMETARSWAQLNFLMAEPQLSTPPKEQP